MDKRFLIIVLLFVLFFGIIFFGSRYNNAQNIEVDISKILLTIGEWKGENTLKDSNIFDILETNDVLVRKYDNGNDSLSLAIVYYGGKIEGFHRPEACFTGQGAEIIYKGIENFKYNKNNIKLNKLIFQRGEAKRALLYFFYSGGYISGSYKNFRLHLMLNKIKGKKHGAAMIQVSKEFNGNEKEAIRALKGFISESIPFLKANLY